MDLDGIKRRRPVYRSPRLALVVRTVEVRSVAPSRLARPAAFENFVIRDVVTVRSTPPMPTGLVPAAIPHVSANDQEPVTQPQTPRVKVKHQKLPRFMYAAAVVVVVVGTLLTYQAFLANTEVEIQVKKLQNASASDGSSVASSLPTDTKPTDPNYVQNYKVAPLLPQLLTIQKIGVKARILQVGVDKDNKMDVPKTAYDTAWYNGSSRPGENGAMVIDGHVQGVGGGAVFTNLNKLVVGDLINVQRGDGKQYAYKVVKVETIPLEKVDTGKLLVSVDTSKAGLNLITCAGNYDQQNGQFDSRTIVYALQQ